MTLRPRALLVEDDPIWQELLSDLLDALGYHVDLASDLAAGICWIAAAPHALAIIDLSLSEADHMNKSGLEILGQIKQRDPDCTAIMLSGHATAEDTVVALQKHGAYTLLFKNKFKQADFRELIRGIQAQRAIDSSLTQSTISVQPAVSPAAAPAPAVTHGGSVLLVEDDAAWQDLLGELLRQAGYGVTSCGSFSEAASQLQQGKFSLAVIDLSLASEYNLEINQHGVELLHLTRARQIPAMVVSGYADPQTTRMLLAEFGVQVCLEKQSFNRSGFVNFAREAGAHQPPGLALLTRREREVAEQLSRGLSNQAIAESLYVSPNTVKRHLKSIFVKLKVTSRGAAIAQIIDSQAAGS